MFLATVFAQAQPTTSAPVPPARNATDVISIYGEAYTNIAGVNYNPNWGQSGTVDIAFNPGNGNLAMAYTNFNYQGTGFEANPQNASAMEFVHIDIWTSNATVVRFSPIDNSGTGAGETLVDVPLSAGNWRSVDLPKSAFTGMTWNSVFQLKFDGQAGVSPSTIYLDNIYFWKSPTAASSDATLSSLQVNGANVPAFAPSAFNYTYGVPGGSAIPQITSAVATNPAATVTAITQATSIPGNATVLVTAANGTTTATYTISYFYSSPAAPAPTPTLPQNRVISMFSDAYANVSVDTWNTSWSQATYEEVTIEGNATKKYTNVGFNGIETIASPINASGMTYLHMDVWTPNVTVFNMKLVSFLGDGFGGANGDSESNISFNLNLGAWNQLQIPMANFTAAGLTGLNDLSQHIFTSSTPFGSGTLFIDNVYFSTDMVDVDDNELADSKVVLYPNPARAGSEVFITSTDVVRVELFNLSGQLLSTTATNSISLRGLGQGVYLARITDQNGAVYTRRLMVD